MDVHENERIVREAVGAFTGGDMDKFVSLLADDFTIHIPGKHQIAGDHKKDKFLGSVLPKVMELTGGTLKVEPHDFLGSDEHGVVLLNFSADRDGKSYSWIHTNVYHVRDGKLTDDWWQPYDIAAVEALFA